MIANLLLAPFSFLYRCLAIIRNSLYDLCILRSYRSSLKIISVGNITAGGNGKTPLTMLLSSELTKAGYRPVILSRGYRGKIEGPTVVTKYDTVEEVGDEPKLMANKGHLVVVAKDRVAGAKFVENRQLGDVIILDDGFQHRRLERDIDIVCIDVATVAARQQLVSNRVLPAGRLREPLKGALDRLDCIVFACGTGELSEEVEQLKAKINLAKPSFKMLLEPLGVFHLNGTKELFPTKIVSLCGIAKPQNFLDTLTGLGFVIDRSFVFRDHHHFSEEELKVIFSEGSLPVVCTEKDEVKLRRHSKMVPDRLYVLKTKPVIPDIEKLLYFIKKKQ